MLFGPRDMLVLAVKGNQETLLLKGKRSDTIRSVLWCSFTKLLTTHATLYLQIQNKPRQYSHSQLPSLSSQSVLCPRKSSPFFCSLLKPNKHLVSLPVVGELMAHSLNLNQALTRSLLLVKGTLTLSSYFIFSPSTPHKWKKLISWKLMSWMSVSHHECCYWFCLVAKWVKQSKDSNVKQVK